MVPNAVFFCLHVDGGSLGKSSVQCDFSLISQVGPWAILPVGDPMAQKESPVRML